MTRELLNFKTHLIPVSMLRIIICVFSLFYLISCGDSTPSPSSGSSLEHVKPLTLEGVTENSITVSWELLKPEGVADPDPTIVYTVYVETTNEKGVFPNDGSSPETAYILTNLESSPAEFEVTDLSNHTPYRIVVEAKDNSGTTSRSRLSAYTASEWSGDDVVSEVKVDITNEEVTAIWATNSKAQGYVIKSIVSENQFGGEIIEKNIISVVCLPGSPLCEGDEFSTEEGDKLKYKVKVDRTGVRYDLVVVPFNFRDLEGLRAVDGEGRIKTFIEEVLAQTEVPTSALFLRLQAALSGKVQGVEIDVEKAGAPVNLELSSTGSTVKAIWGHGEGADFYYAFITSNAGVNAVTNTINRYESDGRYAGGGFTGFRNLATDTRYTVTVQSFTVVADVTNIGKEVSGTITTLNTNVVQEAPVKVAADDLTLTNKEAGKFRIVWNTPEASSVIGYNVFYWTGNTPPAKPKYVTVKGETNITLTVDPHTYNVRVDVLSTYPGQEVVTGETAGPIIIYAEPSTPTGLGVFFSRVSFVEIGSKLYATRYPLDYTGADTIKKAGGPLANLFYHYRYRVAGGEWESYVEITDEAVVDLLVDDLRDAAAIKAGYGKKYQVELVASNDGGFVSEPATLTFDYKSFPEPFVQNNNLKVIPGDRSLTVTWPEVTEKNGSTVVGYTVVLNQDLYALPVRSATTSERKMVFNDLENNQPYYITVIPNGKLTGNVFTALSRSISSYTSGDPIVQGSEEERILTNYTGIPPSYTPQGTPEAVVNLKVNPGPGNEQATVTWKDASTGSPATEYELQYLKNVAELITYLDVIGDNADSELSDLSWGRAVTIKVPTNSTDSYSKAVSNLNVASATNVFRVRPVRIDDSGKQWRGAYRYYALGTDPSWPPDEVTALVFSDYRSNSFRVSWVQPTNAGRNKLKAPARLDGYRVSWGTDDQVYGQSNDIRDPGALSYEITDLTPGTQYYVRVQAKNDNTEGYIYNVGTTGTTYTIKPPGQVVDSTITYSGHTGSGFEVSWTAVTDAGYSPEGELSSVGYLLEWSSDQGTTWIMDARDDYSTTSETLTGLASGTTYRVRVTTTNGFSSAPHTEGAETSTISLPDPVTGLKVTSFTRNTVTLSWVIPEDLGVDGTIKATLSGYLVKYKETDTENEFAHIDEKSTGVRLSAKLTTGTSTTVAGLSVDTKYTFLVVASNSAGRVGVDADAPTVTQTTDKAVKPPINLRLNTECRDDSSVALTWDPSDNDNAATYYKIYRKLASDNSAPVISSDISGTSYTDEGLKSETSYNYQVQACSAEGCSDLSAEFPTTTLTSFHFKGIVASTKTIPHDLSSYDRKSREIFSRYNPGASLVVKYIRPGGFGGGDSFEAAAGDLKTVLNGVTSSGVHVILMAEGTYKAGSSISMKNNVAIVGGVDNCLEPAKTGTILDGEGKYQVFYNSGLNGTALLYGVTITRGKYSGTAGGGGMYNDNSSPSLIDVTFSGNTANYGGGMHNWASSSPTLFRVTFSGNSADEQGGGMSSLNSSPTLIGVTFSENTAKNGGGMYNNKSSPTLYGTTFTKNKANTGEARGGAMYNNIDGENRRGPYIINSIFWGNEATGGGKEIFLENNSVSKFYEPMNIHNSIIKGGTGSLVSGQEQYHITLEGIGSLDNPYSPVVITFSGIISQDPGLLQSLANNGGLVSTHAIPNTSPAVNKGLYMKMKWDRGQSKYIYYYSVNNTAWYSDPGRTMSATLPGDAEDVTDATGHTPTDQPDLGAYEYR